MKNAMDIDYSDLHWGKYDSPIAQYISIQVMGNGDLGDDYESNDDCTGMARFGRRVQWWDDQGFVGCDTFATVTDAIEAFEKGREWYYSECEKCGEKVHNDSESWYEHEKYECEPTRAQWEAAGKDATLGVGHVWTNVSCRAYRTLNPRDCTCRGGLLDEFKQAEAQLARDE